MKEWTKEERYRVLQSAEEIKGLHARIRTSVYRQAYHVQPVTGLSSDPNGFAWHQGTWHLFYQWCPWGAVHGLKYWYHVTSKDLVHWKNEGIGLKPDTFYDNKGAHSGSGISADGELYLFYTGNHRDEDWVRTPYTCVARLGKNENGKPVKLPEPLFGPRAGYSDHQRDPKAIYHAQRKTYYLFIGAQSLDKKGCVLAYASKQLLEGWSFAGELKVLGYEDFGGMWECPCIGQVDGKDVLIFSPQYLKLAGRAQSTNHNVYLLGHMDYDTLTFTPESDYRHLDFGFDFYAAQLASDGGSGGGATLIAWMGLPDNHYPTEPEEWEGSLTLPRTLHIRDGRLVQTPVDGMEALRRELLEEKEMLHGQQLEESGKILHGQQWEVKGLPQACEMELGTDGQDFALRLFTAADGSGGMVLQYDAGTRVCTVGRTGMEKRFNEAVGETLGMPLEEPLGHLQIFIDRSSVEIFANHGEAVFTSHVYPCGGEHFYTGCGKASLKLWELGASVKDDFVM